MNTKSAITELANLEDNITRVRFQLQRQSGTSGRQYSGTGGGGGNQENYSTEQSRSTRGGSRRGRKNWSSEQGGGRSSGQQGSGQIDNQIRQLRSRFDKVMNRLTQD